MEAYFCNIWVTETLDVQKDPKVILVEDWVVDQSKDPTIRESKYLINIYKLKGLKVYSHDPQVTKQYLRQCSHLVLHKGVIYRWVTPSKEYQNALQLVISQSYQKKVLQGCHDDIGLMGLEGMFDLQWDQFYWPGMTKDAGLYIVRYDQCIWYKSRSQKAVMENIPATHPLQLVHLDYLIIKTTEVGKNVHVFIITDHFMRYAQSLVSSSQTAKCTAQALWDQFVVHYSLPENIISDQGQNFESDLISELCKLAKVQKLCTSPNHPQTNGSCEQFIHSLITMLGTLPPSKKSSWRNMVPMLVHT